MYQCSFSPQAIKDLKKLDPKTQKRIVRKIEFFASTPNPVVRAHQLINDRLGSYRFRIGDYRVVFDLEDETLHILAIGHRRDIYR